MAKDKDVKKRKFLLKTVGNVLSYTLIILLVICVALIAISAITDGPGNGLSIGPYKLIVVLSDSMNPSLSVGSLAIAKGVPQEVLSVGDIITYHPLDGRDTLVTHRISEKNTDNSFLTKGDASNAPDSNPVLYEEIVGKVVFSIPFLGYVFSFIKTPPGIITLVAFVIICELFSLLIKSKKGEKDREKSHDEHT